MVSAKFALRKTTRGGKKRQKREFAQRAVLGVYAGQLGRTSKHIVAKMGGDAIRCRTIHRVLAENRWDHAAIMDMEATPRHPKLSSPAENSLPAIAVDELAIKHTALRHKQPGRRVESEDPDNLTGQEHRHAGGTSAPRDRHPRLPHQRVHPREVRLH